jgi:hypothetical protein
MAETNTTTTLYDVLKHRNGWSAATNISSAHEENNFKVTLIAGGTVNGEARDQKAIFPICIPTVLNFKDGDLCTMTLDMELMSKATLSGVWTSRPKTMRDLTVKIEDLSGLLFTLDVEEGDFAWEEPFDDRVIVYDRNVIVGSRKGKENVGKITSTLKFRAFADT